jgi:DNA-binding NarL/FixJ family response regulator
MARADDRAGDVTTMAFARMLVEQPSLDEVVRLVVALLCWPVGARGAMILTAFADHVDVIASHAGQDLDRAEVEDQQLPSDVVAIVRAAAARRPVLATMPRSAADRIMAAWPLGTSAEGSEVLLLFLAAPVDPSLVSARVGDLADVLGVYLAGAGAADVPHPVAAVDVAVSAGAVGLTTRQLRIVELMADEFTNPQISSRIGFSTSTVRMESLRIYRALGVHDRSEAVVTARGLGLLAPE